MLDNFFLLYANKLFKDNSKYLIELFQELIEQKQNKYKEAGIYNEYDEVRLEVIAHNICIFSDCSDFDSALKKKDKIKTKTQELFENKRWDLTNSSKYVDLSFEAVFFYRYGWCDGTWHENGSCIGYHSDKYDFGLDDNVRLKCHECRQLFFRHMLMEFVSGKEFLEVDLKNLDNYPYATLLDKEWVDENFPEEKSVVVIDTASPESFHHYVSAAYDCVEIYGVSTKRHVQKVESFSLTNLFDDQRSIYPLYTRFNDFLISVVSYSLVEFLRKNNDKKLKFCPYCNNFFIAKSINRKTRCYEPDCEKAYQRDKKRKQRDKDPVRYY
jgi:hypothetical protein